MNDPNNHQVGGTHYTRLAVQPWEAMAAWMSREAFAGFLWGNAIKYLARNKGGREQRIEDLRKAQHYLDKLIAVLDEMPGSTAAPTGSPLIDDLK